MLTFSNPRTHAEFADWPLGGNKRGLCVFSVEHHPKRGYRVGRTTTGKTKFHTYGGKIAIVDGSDGKTYILQNCGTYAAVTVSRSDFMNSELGTVFAKDERYGELLELVKQANPS